ncbi:MAG: O-antigen ligase family protein [Gammaproteobacteria bacterium]|nr:O-antigen ligase family protein [Gammaproteobacteria bacterium]
MVLSLPDAVNFQESFRKVLSFTAYYLMGVSVISLLADEPRKHYLINGIGVLLFIWCLDASWQSYTGSNILGFPYTYNRLSGMFYPKLRLGLVLAILSPLYFEFIRHLVKKYSWVALLLIPYIYVITLSGNKSSWIMLSISVFLYIIYLYLSGFFLRLTKSHVIITLIICLAGIALLSNTGKIIPENKAVWIEDRMHSIVSLMSGDIDNAGESFHERIKIWEGAIRVSRDHWINGVGPRGFRYIVDDYITSDDDYIISRVARRATHPHQIVLEIMTETGVIGVIGYLLFLILILKEAMKLFRDQNYDALPDSFPVIIAVFPISTYMAFYGNYIASLIWVLITLSFTSNQRT